MSEWFSCSEYGGTTVGISVPSESLDPWNTKHQPTNITATLGLLRCQGVRFGQLPHH